MLRRTWSSMPVWGLAALVLLACASLGVCTRYRVRAAQGRDSARAVRFLAAQPPPGPGPGWTSVGGHGDIDGDGVTDCWRMDRLDTPGEMERRLVVWRGCRAPAAPLAVFGGATSVLSIPESLGARPWLLWIAGQLAGRDHVSCAGDFPDCSPADPAWRWVLGATDDGMPWAAGQPQADPRWQPAWTRPSAAPRALIVPWASRTWYASPREGERPIDGPRILIDLTLDPPPGDVAPPIACAGLEVRAAPGGLVGVDAGRARWRWLFHSLPGTRSFAPRRLRCHDGVVLATTGGDAPDVIALEPHSGGYVLSPGAWVACHWHWEGACATAELHASADGWLWRSGELVVRISALRDWLAEPSRSYLSWVADQARPELADPAGEAAATRGQLVTAGEPLVGGTVSADAIADDARRGLAPRGTCAGWHIYASTTAILVERGHRARWALVEPRRSVWRLGQPRCEAGRLIVERTSTEDDLAMDDSIKRSELAIDLVRERWQERAARPGALAVDRD